jgi:hypothetical protein
MVTPQANYIQLQPEKTKVMRFDKWFWEDREITDPKTRQQKPVRVMVLHCTEEDGKPVDLPFSALSYKLQQTLAPLIESGALFTRTVSITWHARDYSTEYTVALG